MAGVLDGVRVLDLSRILAGPWSTQLLADLGAEVIKIERPGVGDDTRTWGPPFAENEGGKEAAYFMSANRGKKSLTLDFTKPEGRDVIYKLVESCDVLVENFKYLGLEKYGLDYTRIQAINPKIIYCSITGFGQTGPLKSRAGYDFLMQGMGGLMSITGEAETEAHGGPQKVGVAVADLFTGLYASNAIIAALFHCLKTGEGQYVDLALLDCQVAVLANQAMNAFVSGDTPKRMGNAHINIVPYQVFEASDGHLILAVGNDLQFGKFCEIAGCAELASDARFATNPARVANRNILIPMLEEIMLKRGRDEWIGLFESAAVPCGPINTINQVFEEEQIQARALKVNLPHATLGTVPLVGCPIKYSNTPIEYTQGPPTLGEHTHQVLKDIVMLEETDIKLLKEKNII